jgi:hypothetical protein
MTDVWLTHPETGGYFLCPADAVEAWTGEPGWQVAETPPAEPNPVIAERVAAEQAAARARAAEEEPAKPAQKSSSRKGGTGPNPEEG